MFDFSRISETIGGLIGQSAPSLDGELAPDAILQRLQDVGIDTSSLESLGGTELLARLSELGIDTGNLDPQAILQQLSEGGGGLTGIATDLLSRRG